MRRPAFRFLLPKRSIQTGTPRPDVNNMSKATIGSALAGDHAATFSRAILNILSTDIAEETYAQIVDGLPIARVAMQSATDPLPDNHPLHDQHKDLCAGVLEKTHKFRKTFDPLALQLDATVSLLRFTHLSMVVVN